MGHPLRRHGRWLLPAALLVAVLAWLATRGPSEAALRAIRADLARPDALLLDVRTPGEFSGGHLEGAVNVPVQELEQRLAEVGPTDRPVVVYCRSGVRSARAAGLLEAAGFTRVHDLGGIGNGEAASLATVHSGA